MHSLAQVVLREHGETESGEDTRVDTDREITELGDQDGSENIVEADLRVPPMQQPEWNRPAKAYEKHVRDEL